MWPFRGTISFEILNQSEDEDHKEGKALFMESYTSGKNQRVSVKDGKNTAGWGGNILKYDMDDDEDDGEKYIRNDCLYIRVS